MASHGLQLSPWTTPYKVPDPVSILVHTEPSVLQVSCVTSLPRSLGSATRYPVMRRWLASPTARKTPRCTVGFLTGQQSLPWFWRGADFSFRGRMQSVRRRNELPEEENMPS